MFLWFRVIKVILILNKSFIPAHPIVTIESDDWGGLRGLDWGSDPKYWSRWSHYDCLESPEDVKRLSTMLLRHHDSRGRTVVITANVVFESIGGDWVTKKIKRRRVSENVISSWKEAMMARVFYPQLHAMRESDEYSVIDPDVTVREKTSPYMVWAGNRFVDLPEERVEKAVLDGQELFYKIFGFNSISTVPPRYLWGDVTDRAFVKAGIRYVQGKRQVQNIKRSFFQFQQVVGERTLKGLMILSPRVSFEQAWAWKRGKPIDEFVNKKTNEILRELNSHKPVAISTHRVNYVSCHNLSQAEYGIMALDRLLDNLFRYHPDLIVLTSTEMGQLLEGGYFTDVFTGEMVKMPNLSLWQLILSWTPKRDLLRSGLLFTVLLGMLLWVLLPYIRKKKL